MSQKYAYGCKYLKHRRVCTMRLIYIALPIQTLASSQRQDLRIVAQHTTSSVQAYQCVKKNNYRCNFGKFTAYDSACGRCFQASKKLSAQFKRHFNSFEEKKRTYGSEKQVQDS